MEDKVSRRGVLKAGIGAAGIAAAAMIPNIAKGETKKKAKYKWRMQCHWPPGLVYYPLFYEGFCNRVREASDGEIDITPLPPGAIVPTKDVFEAVGRGLFECAFLWPAYWVGKVPVAGHFNGQLFTWDNFEEMLLFFNEMGAMKIIQEAYAEHNLYPLFPPQATSGVTLYSKKPIRTIDDLKGYKVRSTGIPASVFKKAGATPVFFPGAELYQALQTGVCEGAHWGPVSGGWAMKFQEVCKYIVRPNLAKVSNGEVFFNINVWNKLPSDVKLLLEKCAMENSALMQAWTNYYDLIYMKKFVEEGMGEVVNLDDESIHRLTLYSMEVVEEYSKMDPKYCGKVGDLLKEFMKLTGKV